MPEFLIANYPIPFYLGGTSVLIVVVVAIDTVTQVQTRLMSSQYEQLLKNKIWKIIFSECNNIWTTRSRKRNTSKNIVKKFNLFQISTGDLLRNEVKNKTDIGKDIENIISKGDFATDEIVNELIKKCNFDPKKKIN